MDESAGTSQEQVAAGGAMAATRAAVMTAEAGMPVDTAPDAFGGGALDETEPSAPNGGAYPNGTIPFELADLGRATVGGGPGSIDLLRDVQLRVKIELGRTRMAVQDVLKLGEGSVVELDKLAGDPVDVYVNERLIARGEVLVLNDNFCVRVSEIISPSRERSAARAAG